MNAYAIGILISLVIYFAIGNYAGRKVRHVDDYFVAGRRAPTLLIVGTLIASLLSTSTFLGEVGMAYMGHGAILLMLVAVNVPGYVAGAILFGRHLRRSRALTVAEYFGQRFASRRVQVAAGLTIIVGLGAYLVAVTQGAALILTRVSDVPFTAALCFVWAGYTLFTLYAGSRGVVITDTIMFLLFTVVCFTALPFIVGSAGGWFPAIDALAKLDDKPGIIAWHGVVGPGAAWQSPGEAVTWAIVLGLAWSVVVAVSPWQASRYLMARSEQVVIRAACGASLALLFMHPVLMFTGAAINLGRSGIEPADGALIWAAQNLMPTPFGVLLMTGVMAAALSSATTFLSLVGFSTSNDLMPSAVSDDRRRLRAGRLCMLVVGLLVLLIALAVPPRIFWITYFAATVFASSWGPVALMSVWSARITADAAFWGIIVGFAGNIVPKALDHLEIIRLPVWGDPIIIGAVLSTSVILFISRRGSVTIAEQRYRESLHQVPAAELDPRELARTRRWAGILVAGGVLLSGIMIAFWALPLGSAAGAALASTGELWMSVGCGLVLVLCGWAVHRHLSPR